MLDATLKDRNVRLPVDELRKIISEINFGIDLQKENWGQAEFPA